MRQTRTIVQSNPQQIAVMDVFSRLVQDRIIFIDDEINDELASEVIAQLLYLDAIDKGKPISMYINSPGGSVLAGFGIYDVARKINSPIKTICVGMAASMAAILMLCGEDRAITKHGRIMLHQPQSGVIGTCDEIEITCEEVVKLRSEIFDLIEERTSLVNARDLFRLDKWYNVLEALEVGLVTEIL